jgi:predicted transcriptional regulator
MTKISTLHQQWLQDPAYQEAFEATQLEFELAHQLIEARIRSGLSQEEVAAKMGTSQSAIARLESGTRMPSMRTLARFAQATQCHLHIRLTPHKVGG